MGNKHGTQKKDGDFPGEIRGRSRSFTGFSTKFRRKSKSPTRERSSSVSEQRPKRGSFKSSQVSDAQNGHLKLSKTNSLPVEDKNKPVSMNWSRKSPVKEDKSDASKLLSTSAPQRSRFLPHHQNSATLTFLDGKDTLGRDTIRKSFTQHALQDSPRSSVHRMRQLSNVMYGDRIANLSLRRGIAVQNRDMSLSQASLSKISIKSRSLHSLLSDDLENDLLAESNIEFDPNMLSSEPKNGDPYFMRPRTGSAPASEFKHRQNKRCTLGTGERQRRRISHQIPLESTPIDTVSPGPMLGDKRSPEEVIQARRMLVFRALKTEEGIVSPDSSKIHNDKPSDITSPTKSFGIVSVVPGALTNRVEARLQESIECLPRYDQLNTSMSLGNNSHNSCCDNEVQNQGINYRQYNIGTHLSRSSEGLSDKRSVSPRFRPPVTRPTTPKDQEGQGVYSQIICTENSRISPVKEESAGRVTDTNRCLRTPPKKYLPNIDEYKILTSNVPKSDHWGSYESLTRDKRCGQKNCTNISNDINYMSRERSNCLSFNSPKQVVKHEKLGNTVLYENCISPIMDYEASPRLRLRSSSLSVLHDKNNLNQKNESHQKMNRLWSYSVTSLCDLSSDRSGNHSCSGHNSRFLDDRFIGENDLNLIRLVNMETGEVCPICHLPFDKGKKRKLTDACGHERCYTCMFNHDSCPLCDKNVSTQQPSEVDQTDDLMVQRTRMKTNGHFTPKMQIPPVKIDKNHIDSSTTKPSQQIVIKPRQQACNLPVTPTKPRFFLPICPSPPVQQLRMNYTTDPNNTRYYSSDSAIGSPDLSSQNITTNDDLNELPGCHYTESTHGGKSSPSPPPPDVAQCDLMMRLGLLLGDKGSSSEQPICQTQTEETFTSVSSLGSSEAQDRGISDASPFSTLTASSGSEGRLSGMHMGCVSLLQSSRDQNIDSSNNTSPQSTFQRPHSITTSQPGQIEDLGLFNKRHSPMRRSARAAVGHHYESKGHLMRAKPPQLYLFPINFEIPHPDGKPPFVGREWLFHEIRMVLAGEMTSRGVVISGGIGAGKTAIIEQLIDCSCFGDGKSGLIEGQEHKLQHDHYHSNGINYSPTSTLNSSPHSHLTGNITYDSLHKLGSQVVAFHFCQADNNVTCLVPEFVHSLAARLCLSPQLSSYRELLLHDTNLQDILSLKECLKNPSNSFLNGIVEPLKKLKETGKIHSESCLILVDSLNEAEFHKPDYGDTIASFLSHHIEDLPLWLKLIVTVQTVMLDITQALPFSHLCIDRDPENPHIGADLQDYVNYRLETSPSVKNNIALNGRFDTTTQTKFCSHMQTLSKGSFLFCKWTLDLIEQGHLVLKSSNYKILPMNISEVFLLHFNIKFPSVRSFEKVSPILGVCLATLYPLKKEEIFATINSGYTQRYISWEDFSHRLQVLSKFIHERKDGTYMFFHPAFREWLIRRDDSDNPKFLCDIRHGHALMAFKYSRVDAPLSADKTIELGHHILKAHIYKNISKQRGYSSRDMQAYWMALSADNLNSALACHRNLYSPNVKVTRLILLSGANPNARSNQMNHSPVLVVHSKEGFTDSVALLLEFNASVDAVNEQGMSALCFAAAEGHLDVIKMLCRKNARLSHVDKLGQCPAVHAAMNGQQEALAYLLQCDWSSYDGQLTKTEAMQQAIVAGSAMGHIEICDYLVHTNTQMVDGFGINCLDTLAGESPLSAACTNGQYEMARWFLDQGADVHMINTKSFTPFLCAIESGKWDIADMLLSFGAQLGQVDKFGRTALMIAAYKGHIGVVEMLLARGASVNSCDKEGLTALSWGCLKGHMHIIQILQERGSDLHHTDSCGRSPLQLAAFHGDPHVVQYLIEQGANIEHEDGNGMRALDRAIDRRNTSVVIIFLRKGAKLGHNTWAVASGKSDVMLILLNKLMEDGNVLYKKNRIKEAVQRYQYALKKFPQDIEHESLRTFKDVNLNLLLNLSRCKRKLGEYDSAVELSTKALEIKPNCFEAFYARARAKRDNRQGTSALEDLKEALKLAPNNRELQRLLMRLRDECREQIRYENIQDDGHNIQQRRREETSL